MGLNGNDELPKNWM